MSRSTYPEVPEVVALKALELMESFPISPKLASPLSQVSIDFKQGVFF